MGTTRAARTQTGRGSTRAAPQQSARKGQGVPRVRLSTFVARQRVLELLQELAALQDTCDDIRVALTRNPPPAASKAGARAAARVAKLEDKMLARAVAIRRLREGAARAVVCAFVVFRSEAARDACVAEYTGRGSRVYTLACWGQRMDLRLGGRHRLTVRRAGQWRDTPRRTRTREEAISGRTGSRCAAGDGGQTDVDARRRMTEGRLPQTGDSGRRSDADGRRRAAQAE